MKQYLVVWQDCGDVMQSEVCIDKDPAWISNNEWIYWAARSEGYTLVEVARPLNSGYELFLVCDFPETFYV